MKTLILAGRHEHAWMLAHEIGIHRTRWAYVNDYSAIRGMRWGQLVLRMETAPQHPNYHEVMDCLDVVGAQVVDVSLDRMKGIDRPNGVTRA